MPTVQIEHDDGTTETIPGVESATETDRYGEMSSLTLGVAREDARAVTLEPKRDLVTYEGETYRLVNVDPATDVWTLEAKSREWDAKRVPPLPGGEKREGTDKELIEGLIAAVPEWSAGSIAELTGPMTFVFNHARPNEAIRRVEKNVPGVVSYAGDGTVTYQEPPAKPSDPTTVPEVSARESNIDGTLKIEDVGREVDGTHIRVLGAHEGEAQYFAQLVPEADPNTYANEVRYQTDRWDSAADTDWDRWENKDVVGQDTIEEEAAALANELDSSHYEVRTTKGVVPAALPAGETLARGDWVRAVKETADFDELVRIHEVKRIREGTTVRLKLVMSTRQILFDEGDKALADVQRFNVGFQGSSVVVSNGPVFRAVDSGNPLEFGFRYPDVEYEDVAEVRIEGLPYRVDSRGAADGGGIFQTTEAGGTNGDTTEDNADFTNVADSSSSFTFREIIADTWETIDTFSPGAQDISFTLCHFHLRQVEQRDTAVNFDYRLKRPDGTYIPNATGFEGRISNVADAQTTDGSPVPPQSDGVLMDFTDISGQDLEVQVNPFETVEVAGFTNWLSSGQHIHNFDWLHDHTIDVPDHTHPIDPGIFTTADVPANVSLVINGTTVDPDVGSGTFQTTVDVAGELNPGAWNTIRVESDSLGIVSVAPYIESYKQIGTTE